MCCNTKPGPRAACHYISKVTGVQITQSDWHALRTMAEERLGHPLSNSIADSKRVAYTMDVLLAEMPGDEKDKKAFIRDFKKAKNTVGTCDTLETVAKEGLPAEVTGRKRRGDGKPRGWTLEDEIAASKERGLIRERMNSSLSAHIGSKVVVHHGTSGTMSTAGTLVASRNPKAPAPAFVAGGSKNETRFKVPGENVNPMHGEVAVQRVTDAKTGEVIYDAEWARDVVKSNVAAKEADARAARDRDLAKSVLTPRSGILSESQLKRLQEQEGRTGGKEWQALGGILQMNDPETLKWYVKGQDPKKETERRVARHRLTEIAPNHPWL